MGEPLFGHSRCTEIREDVAQCGIGNSGGVPHASKLASILHLAQRFHHARGGHQASPQSFLPARGLGPGHRISFEPDDTSGQEAAECVSLNINPTNAQVDRALHPGCSELLG